MNASYKILCFGEILWDIFHQDEKTAKVLGGAPSNLSYFFHKLGESTQFISQVGNDELGLEAIQQLQSLQIPHIIPTSNLPTGTVDIQILDHEPHYQFQTPAAWDEIPYSDAVKNAGIQANLIAFGSLAQRNEQENSSFKTLLKILEHNPDATRFLDLNLRAPYFTNEKVLELLKLADILKINFEEFQYLKSLFDLDSLSTRDALFQLIQQLNLNFIILTLGAEGSIVMSETDYSAQSIQKITLNDTVGAGDAFSAAFLTALNRGASFENAHVFANRFSSYICTQKGAFVPIPESFKEALTTFSAW
ncbi:PfkB family carbohydrate kinase [Ignatzschineria sp. LJL83]